MEGKEPAKGRPSWRLVLLPGPIARFLGDSMKLLCLLGSVSNVLLSPVKQAASPWIQALGSAVSHTY